MNNRIHTHCLKTWPEFFRAILQGDKKFEVRKNDRNFLKGEVLRLEEYLPDEEKYTGSYINARITYVLHGGEFGIKLGYCIMGIEII